MVESSDIRDEESLRAWLKGQPREVAVWIAFRGAARVLPLWWGSMLQKDPAQKLSLTVLPVLRCLLVSAVATKRPSNEIKSSAAFAVQNVTIAPNSTPPAMTACIKAARAANEEQFVEVVSSCAASINSAMITRLLFNGKAFGYGEGFSSIARDAKDTPDGIVQDAKPLELDHFSREWEAVKARIAKAPDATEWQFWIDWYDALLAGRTMLPDPERTWDMLEQIALIDPETWDADPETVNREIRKIWESYKGTISRELEVLQAADDGIVLNYNPETDRLFQEDMAAERPDRLKTAVAKLNEVRLLVRTLGNLQGVLGSELFLIERAVDHHPDNAIMVFFNANKARGLLLANIENGSCPSPTSEPVIGLLDTMLLDTQNTLLPEPSVQDGLKNRAEDSGLLDSPESMKALEEAADEIAEVSEGTLADELPENAEKAKDPYQPRAIRMTALVSTVSAILQAWVIAGIARYKSALAEVDDLTARHARIFKNIGIIGGVGYGAVQVLSNSPKVDAAIKAIIALF